MAELGTAAASIKSTGFSVEAFEQIARGIRWINTSVRRHLDSEEKDMLPTVALQDPDLVSVIRQQHWELRNAFTYLMGAVTEVEEGKIRGSSIQELVKAAELVVRLLDEHMKKENEELYPLAARLFNNRDNNKERHE